LPLFVSSGWVTQTVYFLARHFPCFRGPLVTHAWPVGAWPMQRCNDRLAFLAPNPRKSG
jgi:hypothetical protein